jgi:hypothetical protein
MLAGDRKDRADVILVVDVDGVISPYYPQSKIEYLSVVHRGDIQAALKSKTAVAKLCQEAPPASMIIDEIPYLAACFKILVEQGVKVVLGSVRISHEADSIHKKTMLEALDEAFPCRDFLTADDAEVIHQEMLRLLQLSGYLPEQLSDFVAEDKTLILDAARNLFGSAETDVILMDDYSPYRDLVQTVGYSFVKADKVIKDPERLHFVEAMIHCLPSHKLDEAVSQIKDSQLREGLQNKIRCVRKGLQQNREHFGTICSMFQSILLHETECSRFFPHIPKARRMLREMGEGFDESPRSVKSELSSEPQVVIDAFQKRMPTIFQAEWLDSAWLDSAAKFFAEPGKEMPAETITRYFVGALLLANKVGCDPEYAKYKTDVEKQRLAPKAFETQETSTILPVANALEAMAINTTSRP